jgi:hypothetical protein
MRHLKNFKDSGKFSSFFIGCKGNDFGGILSGDSIFFEHFSSINRVFN